VDDGEGRREVPPLEFLGSDVVPMISAEKAFGLPTLLEDGGARVGEVCVPAEGSGGVGPLPDVVGVCGRPALGCIRLGGTQGMKGYLPYGEELVWG